MQTQNIRQAELVITLRRLLAWVGGGSFAAFWSSVAVATARAETAASCYALRTCRCTGLFSPSWSV